MKTWKMSGILCMIWILSKKKWKLFGAVATKRNQFQIMLYIGTFRDCIYSETYLTFRIAHFIMCKLEMVNIMLRLF